MNRQVAIFIETDLAQAELNYSQLELFNDEKISVSSTIQNISDISKIFTDFSQGFTIPCSPVNNAIFKHFYQNDVFVNSSDATIDYQKRYNAYIEIDTFLFRRGKIQLEKANLKNGRPDSYSVTFYGTGVSLKDFFKEDKLSILDYSTLNHIWSNQEIYDRVTTASSVNDYNVRYPLISSKRVWQFGSSVPLPTENLPEWFNYPANNVNNIGDNQGRIFKDELFPAIRVKSLFDLIQSQYQITFNGLFLTQDVFKKAFLYFKNKDRMLSSGFTAILTQAETLQFNNNIGGFNATTDTFVNTQTWISYFYLSFWVTTMSAPNITYYIDLYVNGVITQVFTGSNVGAPNQFAYNYFQANQVLSFKVRSSEPVTLDVEFNYSDLTYDNSTGTMFGDAYDCNATVTTLGLTNLAQLAPDLKIFDFITGICREFNLTIYSTEKNVFTFEPIPNWYSKGSIKDITKYTDISSIEIQRMKLYKTIEFKYQQSESFMNKYFLESPANIDAHGYGDAKIGFDYDGGEYKVESPFENLLHNNFGNNLQVGYCLNKEFAPYVPKPCLLYMNELTTLSGGDKIHWDDLPSFSKYIPFGQDSNILFTQGLVPVTLNFGEEISSFYLLNNPNTLYSLYYKNYINNLYNIKNRLVKVKTVLPVSLLTTLQLNDRLVIRDKRYFINEMQSDLTTGEVNFTLISDFYPVVPIVLVLVQPFVGIEINSMVLFGNGVTEVNVTKSANAGNVTLSQVKFTSEGNLNIVVPVNAKRTITISLNSTYEDGSIETNYIIIEQQ